MYLGVSITTYQHTWAGANKCSLPGLRIFKALQVYCIHQKISSCISLYWNLALSLHSCEQDIIQEFSCYCQRTVDGLELMIEVHVITLVASSMIFPIGPIHKKGPVSYSVWKPSEAWFMRCTVVLRPPKVKIKGPNKCLTFLKSSRWADRNM